MDFEAFISNLEKILTEELNIFLQDRPKLRSNDVRELLKNISKNWEDLSGKSPSTPLSKFNFQTILDILNKFHHKSATHWEIIEDGINSAIKILKYINPNGSSNAQKVQELWSKIPVQKIVFSNEIVIEDACDTKGKLILQGLTPGFDLKKVCESFSDRFGADATSSEKIGDTALEIDVPSDQVYQFALTEGVFRLGGNEIKITAGSESPFITITGINELKTSEIAEKIQDRWAISAKSSSIKIVEQDVIIELPDEESIAKCEDSFLYRRKKLDVSKGGAIIYLRKVQDASKLNNLWEDHFAFKIDKKARLSSNKLIAIIPLSASEMKTIFSLDSPNIQIGGEKVPILRFSLHRIKINFPSILTPDDVKNALSNHINTSEIIDADFMNGTAYIHLKSLAAKKTLISVSPIGVKIKSNKNDAPTQGDYEGGTLKAIFFDNIPPDSKPGFVVNLLKDIVNGKYYVTLKENKAYVEFVNDEDFQKVSKLSVISERTVHLVTGTVPHIKLFLSPVPPNISPAQIVSAFEKAVLGSHPRLIGVSELHVPSDKILYYAISKVKSMKIDETEIRFYTSPQIDPVPDAKPSPKVSKASESVSKASVSVSLSKASESLPKASKASESVSIQKLQLKYIQKYQSKELKEIEKTNNVKFEVKTESKIPNQISSQKNKPPKKSRDITITIIGNSEEDVKTAKEQIFDLVSDLKTQPKRFPIPDLKYSNFVTRYLSKLISETEEPLVFPPTPKCGTDKSGPFISLIFVAKEGSFEESLGTIAIQIEELTKEEVDLPGKLEQLKVDKNELEKKFTVDITETPKGISIFGSPGAIDDVKSFLGEKIGVKSMRIEVQPVFQNGEYRLFKDALLRECAAKLKKELQVDLKDYQEKKTFSISGTHANLKKAEEEIKRARSLITCLEFSKPIYARLTNLLNKYLRSKLKNIPTEILIFSHRKKTNANPKLRSALNNDREDSGSDEDNDSQSDKMSSVTSGSLDLEIEDETKKHEKLVQFKIWHLKDDKTKISERLESLGSFSDQRQFDPSAASILKTYKKDSALNKYFTHVWVKGRRVWFNSLEEKGMFSVIEHISKFVDERNKIKKKIDIDPLRFHFLKNQQQNKIMLEEEYSVNIMFENRDVVIFGSPPKVMQVEQNIKDLLKSLTSPFPKIFNASDISKRDLYAIKQHLEEKYKVAIKIKENQDKKLLVEAIGYSDTNWKEFDDEFLQFSSEIWKPSDYELLNKLYFNPAFDKAKFQEEWNIKRIYFQNSSKTVTFIGRPEDIKSAKEALEGKIVNKQFIQHTIPMEIYKTSLLLNKLVPYGAQIAEIEKKYKVKCTIRKNEKDLKIKGPKESVVPAVAEISGLILDMNTSLDSKIVEIPFVIANELTKNNFKICEEICRETGVYVDFPDWKKSQIFFTLTSPAKNFQVQIVNGDIVHENVDCIVNAANEELQHNGGIAAVISKKAGEALIKECKDIIQSRHRVPTGQAVRTTAGNLPFKAVIHTVGPIWKDGTQNEETLLKSAITAALQEASNASAGIYKYPTEAACKVLIDTILNYLNNNKTSLELVRICDKNASTLATMEVEMHRIKAEEKSIDVVSTSTNTASPFEPPAIAYQWLWRENDGTFIPFDPDQNSQIELAWFKQGQKGTCIVTGDLDMKKNNHQYEINFDNMTELNLTYKSNYRPIKRVPKEVGQYIWEVETSNGKQKLSNQDCGQLELALKKGVPKCEVTWLTGRGIFEIKVIMNKKGFVIFGTQHYLSPKGTPTVKFPVYRVGYEERMLDYLNPSKKAKESTSDNNRKEKDLDIPEKKTRVQLIGLSTHVENGAKLLKSKLDALMTSAVLSKFGNIPPSAMHQLKLICAKHGVRMEEQGPKGDTQIVLNGLESSILAAKSDIYEYMQSIADKSDVQYPSNWESSTNDLEIKQLSRGSKEWNDIEARVKETLPSAQISKIERIQNKWHWGFYYTAKKTLEKKNGNANEKILFHGTSSTPPSEIYTCEKGFDLRFSNDGLWGRAIYFAVNASYSNRYAYSLDSEKQFFLARVLAGDAIKLIQDKSLRKPPKKGTNKSGISEDYDSVTGETRGSQVFMIYELNRCYPEYLITFKA